MSKEEDKVKSIVSILLEHEETLSDGYEYYCGAFNGCFESQMSNKEVRERVEEHLSKIAKEILSKV